MHVPVYDSTPYRWLRYVSPDGGFANVAEIQFFTAAQTRAHIAVDTPGTLHALGDDTVTASVTNNSDVPLLDVRARLTLTSLLDEGRLVARPLRATTDALPAHRSVRLSWRVDVPLDAVADTYAVEAHATWRAGPPSASGITAAAGYATTTVPTAVRAQFMPPTLQVTKSETAQSRLTVTSTAGAPLQVDWTAAAAPKGSGIMIIPDQGSFTVAADGTESATLVAATDGTPGVADIPVTITVASDAQSTRVAAPTLHVSVPYPNLRSAFDNIGITDDSDINPPGLDGGLDGDGSTMSAQELAEHGITPGASLQHGGVTFTWPDVPPGRPDNVLADGQIFQLSGSGHTLGLLTTGTYFPPAAQVTVTYTDGTTTSGTVGDTDWQAAPPSGSDVALTTSYHNWTGTGRVNRNAYLYFHAIALDPGKTVASVTLPVIGDHTTGGTPALHVFAIAIA
jgi:hypothetical protein